MIVDVNECLSSPCGNNATCNNTEGSFICSCKEGFEGNGLNCSGKVVLHLLKLHSNQSSWIIKEIKSVRLGSM
jgi:hypothetical protein